MTTPSEQIAKRLRLLLNHSSVPSTSWVSAPCGHHGTLEVGYQLLSWISNGRERPAHFLWIHIEDHTTHTYSLQTQRFDASITDWEIAVYSETDEGSELTPFCDRSYQQLLHLHATLRSGEREAIGKSLLSLCPHLFVTKLTQRQVDAA